MAIKRMKLLILLFSLSLSSLLFGQYDSEGKVASRFRPGLFWFNTGFKPANIGKMPKYDRLMFDITYNDWTGDRSSFKMRGPSMGMNVNWLFEFPLMRHDIISIALGPSYGFSHLRHDMPLVFDDNTQSSILGTLEDQGMFGKRKFVAHQIALPVEIRFRTKGWRHFKVHLGGKIGYQIALRDKGIYDDNGETIRFKNNSNEDVNRLIYSAHIRIGIRNWALYGSYNFNTMFNGSSSTKLNHFQLGLTVSLF